MERIIEPVNPSLIERELTEDKFLRSSNNGGTLIFHFKGPEAPNTMRELGRLREEAFREAGGGTGKALDVDAFDMSDHPYTQLIVWDPSERLILGGYRYVSPREDGYSARDMATEELFNFSARFEEYYVPRTIELGRSFVQVAYQSSRLRRKGLYALDNLWDGLGAVLLRNPGIEYFFGKVTMYSSFNAQARNALMYFLHKYFPDPDGLVLPKAPLDFPMDTSRLERLFVGEGYKQDFEILNGELKRLGERIPPLIKSYVGLSDTLRVFGTAINQEFGGVEETGIIIKVADVYPEKRARHLDTYDPTESMPPFADSLQ